MQVQDFEEEYVAPGRNSGTARPEIALYQVGHLCAPPLRTARVLEQIWRGVSITSVNKPCVCTHVLHPGHRTMHMILICGNGVLMDIVLLVGQA